MSEQPPSVSVVINTLNRAEYLQRTVQSLRQQKFSGRFEVIVVNGPSTDNTESLLEYWKGKIRVGRCEEPNLSMSRNIGIAMAKGEIVAFLDDDAVPEPEWIEQLAAAYSNEEVGAVGGSVFDNTGYEFQYRFGVADRFGNADLSPSSPNPYLAFPGAKRYPHLLGCNSSFRRQVLIDIGGFDEEFEYYLDETDVCLRVVDAGYQIVQLPDAFVHHKFAPSNIRKDDKVLRNRYSVIKNKIYFIFKHAKPHFSESEVDSAIKTALNQHELEVRVLEEKGTLSQEEVRRFKEDLTLALEIGTRRGHEGVRVDQTLTNAKLASYAGDFLPFQTISEISGKTVVLVSRDFPPGHNGGIATFMHDLACEMADRGNIVHVVTETDDFNRVDWERGVWVHRVRIEHHPKSRRAQRLQIPDSIWNWSATALTETIKISTHRNLDAVEAPIWDCEGIAFLDADWPLVTSLQTTLHFWLQTHLEEASDHRWMREFGTPVLHVEREIMLQSDAIRSISRAIASDIEASYDMRFDASRLVVVPLGLSDISDREFSLPRETTGILFVGRLEARKGIDTLFEAIPSVFEEFPQAHFTIAGDDSLQTVSGKTYREDFVSRYETCAWFDRVSFTGKVTDSELLGLYANCDFLVAPSRFESFGLIYIEAMRAAKAVIGCLTGGVPEVVEDGVTGFLVQPEDSAALAGKIKALLRDKQKCLRMGEEGRSRFKAQFTAVEMAIASERIYEIAQRNARESERR